MQDSGCALLDAVTEGNVVRVCMLLQQDLTGVQVGVTSALTGTSLLHDACKLVDTLTPLLQLGTRDRDGSTALLLAAQHGQLACLQLILSHSNVLLPQQSDVVSAANNQGRTALMLAALHGHAACVCVLLQHEGGQIQLTAKDHQRRSALALAAQAGRPACVQLAGVLCASGGVLWTLHSNNTVTI
jgi:ankyrin repeat protein